MLIGGRISRINPRKTVAEKRICCAQTQEALTVKFRRFRYMFQNPAKFCTREIRIKRKPRARPHQRFEALLLEHIAGADRSVILPDNNRGHCFASPRISCKAALTLIINADAIDFRREIKAGANTGQQFLGIMLDPSWPGII